MTTIVVDTENKIMGSDSRVTGNIIFETEKIFTADDGTLIGFAGTLEDCITFKDWYIAGANLKEKPDFSEANTFSALTLNSDGCYLWSSRCMKMIVKSKYYSIGSGSLAAMASLECGKNIQESIAIAIKLDECSGGEIITKNYRRSRKNPNNWILF